MRGRHVRAAHLLEHYLRTAFEAGGLKWDGDNSGEMDGLVNELIGPPVDDSTIETLREIELNDPGPAAILARILADDLDGRAAQ